MAQDLDEPLRNDGVSRRLYRGVCVDRKSRFVMAMESSSTEGYMSEKCFLPALAGAMPIAWEFEALRRTVDRNACVDLFYLSTKQADEAAQSTFLQIRKALRHPPDR